MFVNINAEFQTEHYSVANTSMLCYVNTNNEL